MEVETGNGLDDLFTIARNTGHLFSSVTKAEAAIPITDTDDDFSKFLANLDARGLLETASQRTYRYYNLVAVSKSDGSRIVENNLMSLVAGRRRAALRRDGYRVSLLEVNCDQDIVDRKPVDKNKFLNPDPNGGRGIPNVITYNSPRIASRKSNKIEALRQKMVAAENNRLRKLHEREQMDRCFVHGNQKGEMRFAGTFDALVNYIQSLIDNGTLNLDEITITMPERNHR